MTRTWDYQPSLDTSERPCVSRVGLFLKISKLADIQCGGRGFCLEYFCGGLNVRRLLDHAKSRAKDGKNEEWQGKMERVY